MSENIIKISSEQGSFDTSGNKNLCDFILSQNSGVYDLSEAHISINCGITNTANAVENDASPPDAVWNQGIVVNESNRNTASFSRLANENTAVLVKNASFLCGKGKVEDLRRCNALRCNMGVYERSRAKNDNNPTGLNNRPTTNNWAVSPVNDLNNEGDSHSVQRNHDIRIPLKSVFNIAQSDAWDTGNYGMSRVHLELELDKLVAQNNMPEAFNATRLTAKYLAKVANENMDAFEDYTNGTGATQTDLLGTDAIPLITKNVWENNEDLPYHTNQQLTISFVNDTAGAVTKVVQVKSMTRIVTGANAGKYSIILTAGVGGALVATKAYTALTMVWKNPVATTLSINKIELVAPLLSNPKGVPSSIQYTTWVAIEDSTPASININRTYYLPPNCVNFVLVQAGGATNPIYSFEKEWKSYRFTMNGVDVTNRSVRVGSGLHYDLLSRIFANQGKAIGNLSELLTDSQVRRDIVGQVDANRSSIRICGSPVMLSPQQTQLGVELEANTGETISGNIIVFAEVVKEI